ncbi:PREDICTED: uncharacterized protein LOC109168704 [Ipomoea nil]|uniref:uncharacterized protein LOC109168704 n=1 Tax=Ipomoea nil TaxID=35883 RepID=UPI000900BBA0|nr:PREDICTED: uncharacterized protein LOC109168704 [Ipomoea nil]
MHVEIKHSVDGIASSISIPKLEKLAFENCIGINEFEISTPKLDIFSNKSFWLCGSSLSLAFFMQLLTNAPTYVNCRLCRIRAGNMMTKKLLQGFWRILIVA